MRAAPWLSLAALVACAGGAEPEAPTAAPAEAAEDPGAAAKRLACAKAKEIWLSDSAYFEEASGDDLNRAGALCLSAGDAAAAVEILGFATDREPTHALAHLNRARAIALAREGADPHPCALDATASAMVAHLRAVATLDPRRLDAARADPQLASARALPPVRLLLSDEADLRKRAVFAVQGARFYAPTLGAAPAPLAFTLTGQAPHQDLAHGLPVEVTRTTLDDAGAVREATTTGTWALDDLGRLLLDLDGDGPEPPQTLQVGVRGDLQDESGAPLYFGLPDECSA